MSDLAIIPVAGGIQDYSDPAAFVELALTRAKEWLVEAIEHGDIAGIVELKSQAEAIRVYTTQKQIGKDAELNAAEIVRRAQRGLALAVQSGQREGSVRAVGERINKVNQWGPSADSSEATSTKVSPDSIFTDHAEAADARAMAEATDEQFEVALDVARTEQNLSRANVVRKTRGEEVDDKIGIARKMATAGNSTRQIATHLGYGAEGMTAFLKRHAIEVPADKVIRNTQHLNSTRIVTGVIDSVNGIGMLFDQITYSDLPAENVQGWLEVLNESIRSLTTLRNRLKETSQP